MLSICTQARDNFVINNLEETTECTLVTFAEMTPSWGDQSIYLGVELPSRGTLMGWRKWVNRSIRNLTRTNAKPCAPHQYRLGTTGPNRTWVLGG